MARVHCAYAFNLVLVQLCKINLQKLSRYGELVSRGGRGGGGEGVGTVRLAFDLAFHLGQADLAGTSWPK